MNIDKIYEGLFSRLEDLSKLKQDKLLDLNDIDLNDIDLRVIYPYNVK